MAEYVYTCSNCHRDRMKLIKTTRFLRRPRYRLKCLWCGEGVPIKSLRTIKTSNTRPMSPDPTSMHVRPTVQVTTAPQGMLTWSESAHRG